MDARRHWATSARRFALLVALLWVAMGAQQRSANFVVTTDDPDFARQMIQAAEQYRRELAIAWLGKPMPNWAQPCEMTVQAAPNLGAGGATTFVFDHGEVFGWHMTIQGSRERLLDSVLPHEITHTIFASHFRQPLPRWADEGGATTVEHASERNKYRQMLYEFLRNGRGIAFNQMFALSEYPSDIMPLYAQGYSLAEYLIQSRGRQAYIAFLDDGLKSENWPAAIGRHYGMKDLGVLQNTWLAWVRQGSPAIAPRVAPQPEGEMLADARRPRPAPNLIHHVSDKSSPGLTPVHIPPSVYAPVTMASNAPSSPPRTLPASGWHAPGAVPAETEPTQAARPPQPEQPPQRTLR